MDTAHRPHELDSKDTFAAEQHGIDDDAEARETTDRSRVVQMSIAAVRSHVQRLGDGAPAADADTAELAATGVASQATALPHGERIQAAFGRHDLGAVQAHVGGAAAASCEQMGAEAYATGNSVAFKNAPSLHTAAHEAAHVIQQRGGVQLKGGVGQEGDVYERHADAVADAVVAGRSAEALLDPYGGTTAATGGDVQLKKEVFDRAAFANPTKYLKGDDSENQVIEEPGSQGILGVPDQKAIDQLADAVKRAALLDKLRKIAASRVKQQQAAEKQASAADASGDGDAALKAKAEAKRCENDLALISTMLTKIAEIYDVETAALFYRQHTLEFSKLGFLPKHQHNKGDGAHKTHTFHKDAGLVKVDEASLQGSAKDKAEKARVLNGPFGTGFVRGHNSIKNMKHRFIDHVHVNKDDDDAGIDIYNADEGQGAKAEAWLVHVNKVDDKLHFDDRKHVEDKVGEKNQADIEELKRKYDE